MASSLRNSLKDFGLVLCEPLLEREHDGALSRRHGTDDLALLSQILPLQLLECLRLLVSLVRVVAYFTPNACSYCGRM